MKKSIYTGKRDESTLIMKKQEIKIYHRRTEKTRRIDRYEET
jgi:hypothetical protein